MKVVDKHDNNYNESADQYASTAHPEKLKPSKIFYAENDKDVLEALKYARDNNVKLSVRTGGHSYVGASSTTDNNVQLDLSRTYLDFDASKIDDRIISCGISFSLNEFSKKLSQHKCYVPHGGCGTVHLGGHITTGGYGYGTRAFGLLGDHVLSFRIILADGTIIKKVTKETDPDLFFAVLGGGPGYGILTHVTLKVYRDEDYPCSRVLIRYIPFTMERYEYFVRLIDKWSRNDKLPKQFNVFITMGHVFSDYTLKINNLGFMHKTVPSLIYLSARWFDNKPSVKYKRYFDLLSIYDDEFLILNKTLTIVFDKIASEINYTPLSEISSLDIDQLTREIYYNLKSVNVTYMTDKIKSKTFVSKYIRELEKYNGIMPTTQIVLIGGKNSQLNKKSGNGTSYSHRKLTCMLGVNCQYIDDKEYNFNFIRNLKRKLIGKRGCFSEPDMRMISFPYNLDDGYSLDKLHSNYFDSQEKYQRLCQIRDKYDPDKLFSANDFCVSKDINKNPSF